MFFFLNYWAASATNLGLLFNDHQFKYPLGHWRFILLLISRSHDISQGMCKLVQTPTIKKKSIIEHQVYLMDIYCIHMKINYIIP